MTRLYRPYIPLKVRVEVAERQFRHLYPGKFGYLLPPGAKRSLSKQLATLLGLLSTKLGCEVKDLRLDHDPPLALRTIVYETRTKRGARKVVYDPHANDPAHLHYRPEEAQYEGSHDIKTRIRGDHGQFSDLALIRREKKRRAKKLKKNPRVWRSKPMLAGKTKWPKRSFPKRNKAR